MKKYVLNIDRLYTGMTANALVLSQVDEDFPNLIPSPPSSGSFNDWINEMNKICSDFDPANHEFELKCRIIETHDEVEEKKQLSFSGKFLNFRYASLENLNSLSRSTVVSIARSKLSSNQRFDVGDGGIPADIGTRLLLQYVADFNLNLQTKFKEKGHQELYMMDDTWSAKPIDRHGTYQSEKQFLHSINGIAMAYAGKKDENDQKVLEKTYSSQMNVLFPYKKISSKSLYASQLKVQQATDVDDLLERSRGITMQGKVSLEKCLQGVVQVGNNIYAMSPNIDILDQNGHIHGNGMTIVNSFMDKPYHFPHSMTLFQPSQDQYNGENLAKESPINFREFIEWYERHSRRTVVSLLDSYGGNVSTLVCSGPGSYELDMATYSPTDIILQSADGMDETAIRLDTDMYRRVRADQDSDHKYMEFTDESGQTKKKYVFDNRKYDNAGELEFGSVGLMFNMYDTFISGNDRILKMSIPQDSDFNSLFLRFDWEVRKAEGLVGDFEATVYVDENEVFTYNPDDPESDSRSGHYELEISDAVVRDHDLKIYVRIHYQVDFGRRNSERGYREMLKQSGVVLKDIRIDNGVSDPKNKALTFGSYVNEPGISEEEFARRYLQFWQVSQYKTDMAYQTVLETPLRNVTTAGLKYANNYSSGDMYGDVFVTKSVLNPRYDMDIELHKWDDSEGTWDDENGTTQMLMAHGRDYIGMGQCSNQLSLLFKPIDIAIGYEGEWMDLDNDGELDPDRRVLARRVNPYPELKYQMVEVVKNINRFESSIKHKSNVFSVVVENSNLAPDNSDYRDDTLEKYKEQLRNSVTQFVRDTCQGIVPVHTQLFDVQFT